MRKTEKALRLSRKCAALMLTLLFLPSIALAGEITTYDDLVAAAATAADGDVLLLEGEIVAGGRALSSARRVVLKSVEGGEAEIKGLQLSDADVAFSGVLLSGGLRVSGESYVELLPGTNVRGASGQDAVFFEGIGSLTIESGATVQGGKAANAVTVRGSGGDVHVAVHGALHGGGGADGGAGLQVENLSGASSVVVSGDVRGGTASGIGGNAVNLYSLGGETNAILAGEVRGGDGRVGGSAVQIVGLTDSVNAALGGSAVGGNGSDFGGDTVVVMNVQSGASVTVAGSLSAGNVPETGERPGVSLRIVDEISANHVSIEGAHLRDGEIVPAGVETPTPEPTATPMPTPVPGITASVPVATLPPIQTTEPEEPVTPDPTEAPTETPTQEPTEAPTEAPTQEPTNAPTAEPTQAPTETPTQEPSQEPATPSEADDAPEAPQA